MQHGLFKDTPSAAADWFEHAWRCYPHPLNRGGKTDARKAWRRLTASEQTAFFKALPEYKALLEASDWRNPCMFKTFLNQKRWEGLLEQLDADRKQTERAEREPVYSGFTESQLRREMEKARKGLPHDLTALRVARAHKIAPEAET